MMKRVLIGCEYSQVIMSEFYERGYDAYSCDLLPCEGRYPHRHFKKDLFSVLKNSWDLVIIHPPCTYLSFASKKYWTCPGRAANRLKALQFFLRCYEADFPHLCIENPLGIASTVIAPHSQIIHPYFFGDPSVKRTCLWLNNLPGLVSTTSSDLFDPGSLLPAPDPIHISASGKRRHFTEMVPGSSKSSHHRSKSFTGIARAMAMQWGPLLI